ncbi:polysaccharide deacetylase family protein [Rubritalea sp.]|uniref:polysaccharide deacetylase family protein n=1 Tax=Rubritalea sp. TaxID=2109375 RepID=UPI003EF59C7D
MIWSDLVKSIAIISLLFAGVWWMVSGQFLLGIGLHGLVVAPLLWGTLNPNSRLFGAIQTRTGSKDLWLTLDDGPDPVSTPVILKLLEEYGVKATFFVIGEKVEKHPDLLQAIYESGHSIGNHTWSHPQESFWCKGPVRTFREIVSCQRSIRSILGVEPIFFRAPVGHSNVFVHAVLRRANMRLMGWSSRGFDGVTHNVSDVAKRITGTMEPGAIVLLHEGSENAKELVEIALIHAKNQDWKFTVPGEWQQSGNC